MEKSLTAGGLAIGGLQEVPRDSKDNDVAAMLGDRTFYLVVQYGGHAMVFLDLQGLVANHLFKKIKSYLK